jgi:hypothetical protein
MLKLNLDTSQLKGSPWNKGAWTVFASYLDTSGRLLLPKKEVERVFWAHLKTLRGQFLIAINTEREASLSHSVDVRVDSKSRKASDSRQRIVSLSVAALASSLIVPLAFSTPHKHSHQIRNGRSQAPEAASYS